MLMASEAFGTGGMVMNRVVENSMIVFFILAVPAVIGGLFAGVNLWARLVGRIGMGLVMLLGGAAVNASFLASGADYATFANDAKFAWVTHLWREVVPAKPLLWIGLLVVFQALMGIMILSGGWPTRIGLIGAILFHGVLGVFFSWFLTAYAAVVLVAIVPLLRAEWRAEAHAAPPPIRHRPA